MQVIADSLTEKRRKELPRGEWIDCRASAAVYRKLSHSATKMGMDKYMRLSDLHVETMAVMGTGHEETMKNHLHLLRMYGWLDDIEGKGEGREG